MGSAAFESSTQNFIVERHLTERDLLRRMACFCVPQSGLRTIVTSNLGLRAIVSNCLQWLRSLPAALLLPAS